MRLLILGKGYVGTHLYKKVLPVEQIETVMFYSKDTLDYTNRDILISFLNEHHVDVVVNASGFTGRPNVDQCEEMPNECWYYNVVAPCIIQGACKATNTKFIQISSGCIYTGYEKQWSEHDTPNFGVFDQSSTYSKTKHASEMALDKAYTVILRIRMPFSECSSSRNFINKLLRYERLISYDNSMTCVEDFCQVLLSNLRTVKPGIYNMVHDQPLSARQITDVIKMHSDRKFEFVDISELVLKAPRSNCVLSAKKIQQHGMSLPPVHVSLDRCLNKLMNARLAEKKKS